MGAGDYSDSAGWGRGLTLAYSIGIPLGVVVGLGMLVFCGYICTRSGTKEIVETAAKSGVGEINQGGWKLLSATERQQQPRLGGRPESGNRGLASCFRNSLECE